MPVHQLPPGQRAVDGFPRFGVDLRRPPPAVPEHPTLTVRGAVDGELVLTGDDLAALPRREVTADLHCVAGWSATGLRWAGTPFGALWTEVVAARVRPGVAVTHVLFRGLDGFCSVVRLEDALDPNVLIADTLDGAPLDGDHGAPLRLVSPAQYGYVSVKHLRLVELHTSEPAGLRTSRRARVQWWLLGLHPTARAWAEERHPHLPAWLVRPVFRALAGRIKRGLWSPGAGQER